MRWYQVTMIVFLVIGSLRPIYANGIQTRNAYTTIIGTMLGGFLLWCGGFWNDFYWPQIVMICLYAIGLLITIDKHGETYFYDDSDIASSIFSGLIVAFIFYKGGFWG